MAGVKTIRALSRGLDVMKALEMHGPATLHELAAVTGLAKPTLLRILLTLDKEGYVRRGIGDQLYHRTVTTAGPSGGGWKAALAEVAAPILDRFCNAVLWPSDLGVYEDGVIHIQETTRRLSPFLLNRDVLSADIHVLPSAMGRAVIAWSSPERRETIRRELVKGARRPEAAANDREKFEALVAETLDKGFGTRQRGYYLTHQREARVSAIARPIIVKGEAVAAVNLAWVGSALSEKEFAARYLDQLADAAEQINRLLVSRIDELTVAAR